MAGPDVTQDLPTADSGVTSARSMPAKPGALAAAPSSPGEIVAEERLDSAEDRLESAEDRLDSAEDRLDSAEDHLESAEDHLDSAQAAEPDQADSDAGSPTGVGRRTGASRRNNSGDTKSAARSAAGRVARRATQPSTAPPGGQPGPDLQSGAAAVRRRLARLGAPRGGAVNPVLEPLIRTVRATHPKADIRLIERAYEAAARMHAGQSR